MRRRYRATLRSEISKPSFTSSPWILGGAPIGILRRQALDERPNFFADPRPAAAVAGSPAPVEAKAGAMPSDHRLRLDDDQRIRPSRPPMPEGRPEKAVDAGQHRPRRWRL